MKPNLKFRKLSSSAVTPIAAYEGDAGIDLTVIGSEKVRDQVYLLKTGLSFETPAGYFLELHARSGIFKTDFIMANQVGIIDPGYRGEIMMPVRYLGKENADVAVSNILGKRFCQLILKKLETPVLTETDELSQTHRGVGGFGSSGH